VVGQIKKPYVVCLWCGREFEYDWNKMRVVRTSGTRRVVKQKKIRAEWEG
jgi:DNA-directed RNA polymerase subunit RPC12/RpoP